jgi:hypothetical protein
MPDNREFCEQIGAALVNLGTKEAMSCMARMMTAVAQKQGADIEFDCDLGVVSVERKTIKLDG